MADVRNPWVQYADRSYEQIKAGLLQRLSVSNPEITDHTENNLLIIILSMFAGVAEMLNYYIDNIARESFISTARKFSSMVKITRILDYRIRASSPEQTDIVFSLRDSGGNLITIGTDATIPQGTRVQDSISGHIYTLLEDLVIPAGQSEGQITGYQVTQNSTVNLGTTSGDASQTILLPDNYVDSTLDLTVGAVPYNRVETWAYSESTDLDFKVIVDTDGSKVLELGNDINGVIPSPGQTIISSFLTTLAEEGAVDAGTLTDILNPPSIPGVNEITSNNPAASAGGSLTQDIEEIRREAPLSIRTLNRAVTPQDYEDLAILFPGVSKAKVYFDCIKRVDLYIAPVGGSIAPSSLLNDIKGYFKNLRMVGLPVNPLPSGISDIVLSIDATARLRRDPLLTKDDIETAVLSLLNFDSSDINKDVRISDIYAEVDNLPRVDFLNITELYLLPYPRPKDHQVQLLWVRQVNTASTSKVNWRLEWTGTRIRIFKDNAYINIFDPGIPYSDPENIITITITSSGLYTPGMKWEFTTYARNEDIVVDDFSVPVLEASNLSVNVNTQ